MQARTMMEVHEQAAEALEWGDVEKLFELRDTVHGWMMPERERLALESLLEAMANAAEVQP